MADIALTAAQIGVVFPEKAEIFDGEALVTITAGQSLYVDPTTGKLGLCDANDTGKEQFAGIALNGGGAGQAISVLRRGAVYGFTLAGNYWALAYQGDTAGTLADAASATKTVRAGLIIALNDKAKTKVLFVDAEMHAAW